MRSLGPWKLPCYIRFLIISGLKNRNIKSWDQQNNLAIRGFCYIRPPYNEVPLYSITIIVLWGEGGGGDRGLLWDPWCYRVFSLMSCCPPTWPSDCADWPGYQGSHAHHPHTQSSCASTTSGGVHGETISHDNVKRCLHKWMLISIAMEAAMWEDNMTSCENALIVSPNTQDSSSQHLCFLLCLLAQHEHPISLYVNCAPDFDLMSWKKEIIMPKFLNLFISFFLSSHQNHAVLNLLVRPGTKKQIMDDELPDTVIKVLQF